MLIGLKGTARDDLATLFGAGALGSLDDAELIARFVRGEGSALSEAAFAVLVDRHGPMVLGVCRRRLGDSPDADDAFQAVFLVLCRRAGSLWVEGSIGPWLHAVALRVSGRALAARRAEAGRFRPIEGVGPVDPASVEERDAGDLRRVIDEEVDRLPARYRAAAVLCLLEGLSREQAARRLRCPVGTVESRLHRARERLQRGLIRRGVAPMEWAPAAVPVKLAARTASAAAKVAAGRALADSVGPAVVVLVVQSLRRMMMVKTALAASVVALGMATAGGAGLAVARGQDRDEAAPPVTEARDQVVQAEAAPLDPLPTCAERFEAIVAEWKAAQQKCWDAMDKATNEAERSRIFQEVHPDQLAFSDRMLALAGEEPTDAAARDALLWVIYQPWMMATKGPLDAKMTRASALLLEHFSDDPEAVRVGLSISNEISRKRDLLIEGFAGRAESHESKGLATFALAQYWVRKAMGAEAARKRQGPAKHKYQTYNEAGNTVMKEAPSPWDDAYEAHFRTLDPEALRAEAEKLYERVVAEYADVPFVTMNHRRLEREVRETPTESITDPEQRKWRATVEENLARKRTLGEEAQAKLDEMHNLVAGKPAPEIEGTDLNGQPLKLSDYRGKVVALVFWASWCGPCMREVPHERELVEKMKGRPFALLGVNVDYELDAAKMVVESERINWSSWFDGDPKVGPITQRYHVDGFPTVFVIDAQGVIRFTNARGEVLDRAVEGLVAEVEKEGGPTTESTEHTEKSQETPED